MHRVNAKEASQGGHRWFRTGTSGRCKPEEEEALKPRSQVWEKRFYLELPPGKTQEASPVRKGSPLFQEDRRTALPAGRAF